MYLSLFIKVCGTLPGKTALYFISHLIIYRPKGNSGACFFEAHNQLKSDGVALAVHNMATELEKQGFKKVVIFMDQNPTHKNLMRYNLALLPALDLQINIQYLPPYLPKLNPVEYLIHLVRQQKLHHAPHQRKLDFIEQEPTQWLNAKQPFDPKKVYNIVRHILKLAS